MISPWHGRCLDLAGITDSASRQDFEVCRRLFAQHGRTYYLATWLLPEQQRPWVWALYGFARYADQLIDDPATASAKRLQEWSEQVLDTLSGQSTSGSPVTRAAILTVARFNIDPALLQRFLRSMQMDATVTDYPTYSDLEQYMAGSAAAIGLWMLPILQPCTPAAAAPAAALGEAFQLTNFIRDVAEDLDRGRIYLPGEDLARFGVDREQLLTCRRRGTASPRVRNLIAFERGRAEELYARAEPGIDLLHPTSRPAIRAAFVLYREILDAIRRQGDDVFAARAVVTRARRLAVFAQTRIQLRALNSRNT